MGFVDDIFTYGSGGRRGGRFVWGVLILWIPRRRRVSLMHNITVCTPPFSCNYSNTSNRFNHDKRHLQEMSLHVLHRGVHFHLLSRVTH
jgi:hypothetical protein